MAIAVSALCTLGVLPSFSQVSAAQRAKALYRNDRIIIQPKAQAGTTVDKFKAQSAGRTLKSYSRLGGLEVVQLAPTDNVEQALARYRASGLVEFAEPDYKLYASALPNDPHFTSGTQWSLRNSSTGRDIHASEAWDTTSSASNIIVAILDTGIRYTHEDLAANMWRNPGEIPDNGIDDDRNGVADDVHGLNTIFRNGDPMDDGDHGTHVAGIIGAVGNNGKGIAGVAWNVKLMACKFLDAEGEGDTSDVIESIDYARRMGAHVINASFGGPDYSSALFTAIQNARAAGIIVVAAAGNETMDTDITPIYPSCYALDNIISVGGTSRSDSLDLGYSNWGANTVDLCAPGSSIYSTWGGSDSSYMAISGTSMAAPHVAGAVALMKARFTNLTSSQIIARLLASVDVIPALQGKCRSGGRLNLAKALGPDPAANFTASRWSGEPPLQVTFTNLSLGDVKQMTWNFGDGSAEETNARPVHTFGSTGEFKVRLTVVGTNSKTNSIEQTVRVSSNYRFAAEPYAWIDTAGMTRITLTDNGVSSAIALPFELSFYGKPQNTVYVGANGIISFAPEGLSTTENAAMPDAGAPNNFIAPYWDNLNPAAGGIVSYGTVGTAPNRRFVVSWVNVPRVSSTAVLGFQAFIEEATGDVIFQYRDVEGNRGAGRGATIGLENSTGDLGALYSHNGVPYLLENRTAFRASRTSYRFLRVEQNSLAFEASAGSPAAAVVSLENTGDINLNWSVSTESPWLTVTDLSGALSGGETKDVQVVLSPAAMNLAAGTYQTSITVSNTTDGGGTRTIPVTLVLQAGNPVLRLIPAATTAFTGGLGGPFQPGAIRVDLTNSGSGVLNWTSSASAAWVSLDPSSGSIPAGTAVPVYIELTEGADSLAAGLHNATLSFHNATVPGAPALSQSISVQVNSRLEQSAVAIRNGRFEAQLSAPAAGSFAVEFSSDLLSWQTLTTAAAVSGTVTFNDAVETTGKRFYRLRQL